MLSVSLGILGGGQLARMTIDAAMRLGIPCHILDKHDDAPAVHYTKYFSHANPLDAEKVVQFGKNVSAITIDSEHVNAAALTTLSGLGKKVTPSGAALAIIQNKCRQKEFLLQHDFPTAPFQVFTSKNELASTTLQYPCVLKRATAGYDGNGVMVLHSPQDLENAFAGESLVEEKVAIDKELAVIVARDFDGNHVVYDPVEMVFDTAKNLLKFQICPAGIEPKMVERAQELAVAAATQLDMHGLLAIEMFLTTNGELLINEMAPRPHNSGHHTIEAAETSQYENLVRVLAGLPLGSPKTTTPSLMINLLGPETGGDAAFAALANEFLSIANAHVHLYGKKDLRPYRKLGHVTLLGSRNALIEKYKWLNQRGII